MTRRQKIPEQKTSPRSGNVALQGLAAAAVATESIEKISPKAPSESMSVYRQSESSGDSNITERGKDKHLSSTINSENGSISQTAKATSSMDNGNSLTLYGMLQDVYTKVQYSSTPNIHPGLPGPASKPGPEPEEEMVEAHSKPKNYAGSASQFMTLNAPQKLRAPFHSSAPPHVSSSYSSSSSSSSSSSHSHASMRDSYVQEKHLAQPSVSKANAQLSESTPDLAQSSVVKHVNLVSEKKTPNITDSSSIGGLQWTEALHARFLIALFSYAIKHASPKKIMKMMPGAYPDTLTMEHIKSHLQKLRVKSVTSKDLQTKLCDYHVLQQYNIDEKNLRKGFENTILQDGAALRFGIQIEMLTDPSRFLWQDPDTAKAVEEGIIEPPQQNISKKRIAQSSQDKRNKRVKSE